MKRRRYLRVAALTGAAAAGCIGRLDRGTGGETTGGGSNGTGTGRGRVYYPPHVHGTSMAGMAGSGPYRVGLMLAAPNLFWTVTGTDLSEYAVEESDDVHLMAVVWHPDTGVVLPEAGVSLEVTRDGYRVSEEVIYPMLSHRMGFHYGGNFVPQVARHLGYETAFLEMPDVEIAV